MKPYNRLRAVWNYFQAHKKLSYNLGLFPFKSVLAISLFCSVFNSSSVLVCLLLLASFSYLRFNSTWQIPAQEYKVKKPLWFDRYSVMCNQKKKGDAPCAGFYLDLCFAPPYSQSSPRAEFGSKKLRRIVPYKPMFPIEQFK